MLINKINLGGQTYEIGVDDLEAYSGREIQESWDDIQQRCNDNNFSGLRVGDYKTVEISDNPMTMRIAGIDTYYNLGDSKKIPHHIDWISKEIMNTGNTYSPSGMGNNGQSSSIPWPYIASGLQRYLNNTIYESDLPEDLKKVITSKLMMLEERPMSGSSAIIESNGMSWQDMGNLWVPSEYEIFGSILFGTKPYSAGPAVQYPLFRKASNRIFDIKYSHYAAAIALTTVTSGNSTDVVVIDTKGCIKSVKTDYMLGLPLCFRIAATA